MLFRAKIYMLKLPEGGILQIRIELPDYEINVTFIMNHFGEQKASCT